MVTSFLDKSYHSPVIASIKTLSFLIKGVFIPSFVTLYTENIGLQDCFGFLQIELHYVNNPHSDFKRTYIITHHNVMILTENGFVITLPRVLWMNDTPHPITARLHGNSKGKQAYVYTLKSERQ